MSSQKNAVQRCHRYWLCIGALLCVLSVVIGAFAAHGLKTIISENQLAMVNTGAKYQMYHGFAILVVSLTSIILQIKISVFKFINVMFLMGVCLFSLSLYILALTNFKLLGFATPIGGVMLILAWITFIWAVLCRSQITLQNGATIK